MGLGLSSTTDCISGWSLTTIRGGRSLLSTWALSCLSEEARTACCPPSSSSSSSLSVSDASPGTCHHPTHQSRLNRLMTTGEETCVMCHLCRLADMQENLGSDWGDLRRRHGGDVDFIIGVRLRSLALHHYLVPAGHDDAHQHNTKRLRLTVR